MACHLQTMLIFAMWFIHKNRHVLTSLGCLITRKLRRCSCILFQELIPIIRMYLYFSNFDIFVHASKNNCFVAGVFKDTKLCRKKEQLGNKNKNIVISIYLSVFNLWQSR